jgi:BirA family biotin operon repressor/biotin-[acetyl-CoA-carboxylase] ligase
VSLGEHGDGAVAHLGHPRLHMRRTDSTNDRARALAIAGAPHGTLVTTSEQTAGRGRQGRRWSAPPGSSLLMSLLLSDQSPGGAGSGNVGPPALLPLIAAVAVCDVAGENARIKWPNDIVFVKPHGLAKLAGILAEGRPQQGWAVLGIGLNVAVDPQQLPAELRDTAATLGLPGAEIEPILGQLLAALEQRLSETTQTILEAWRARDALCGHRISWGPSAPGGGVRSGEAQGIDGAGRLVVSLAAGGHVALEAGEVHLEQLGA